MSVYPCAGCGQRVPGRLASIYSAWFLADGSRTAWKQRLCAPCVRSSLRNMLASAADSTSAVTACPACGSESASDLDPIYLTVYLPKRDPREFALTTCGPCAVRLRLSLQDRAERLPDRNGGDTGRSNRDEDDPFAEALA
jgi:hypothetical protein